MPHRKGGNSYFKVGDILRIGYSNLSLMRVVYVKIRNPGTPTEAVTYYGQHCLGGLVAAYQVRVKLANARDREIWYDEGRRKSGDGRLLRVSWEKFQRRFGSEKAVTAIGSAMAHVDEWIDTPVYPHDRNVAYAKFFLLLKRLPAWMQNAFSEWMDQYKLFCTYENKRYRCMGASRLGDVWLAEDFERENGYDLRVNVDHCKDWSNKP